MMVEEKESSYRGRIRDIESDVNNLNKSVASMDADLKHIGRELGNLAGAFNAFATKMQDNQKTPHTIMFGWSSVVLALVIALGTGFVAQPMNKLEGSVSELIGHANKHDNKVGHTGALIKHENMDRRVTELDVTLQREMRLLQAEIVERVMGIEKRIDIETDILERQMLENRKGVSEVKERISKDEMRVESLTQRTNYLRKQLDERVIP